jgi:hypothetical protein
MDMDLAYYDHAPHINDIKIKYYPKLACEPKFYRFNDYPGQQNRSTSEDLEAINAKPWKPFHTCLDFEIAELMLESHLNSVQSTALLSLIRKAIAQPDDFTLSSTDDLEKVWTAAHNTWAAGVSIGFI